MSFQPFRTSFTSRLLPGIQLALLGAFFQRLPRPWPGFLVAAFALTALYGWWRALRHARAIADTPTSRIASAPQGYTELRGAAQPLEGPPVLSPVSGLPVLWYRVETQEKDGENQWRHLSTVESNASFLIEDESASCVVDPEGAHMLIGRTETTTRGEHRHLEHSLIRNDPLYVLGDFASLSSVGPAFDSRREVARLLAEWKADRPALLERFDLDGNGEIDLREWELARAQAKREVEHQRQDLLAAPDAHLMRRPQDGRLYLISDLDPERLVFRHKAEATIHALLFLAACGAYTWLHRAGMF